MKKGTLCVHDDGEDIFNSITTPIYMTSNYKLNDEKYKKILEKKRREAYVYTRWGNPTIRALEKKMAMLEKGENAIAFSSGMAAIATTFLTFLKKGDELVTHDPYLDYVRDADAYLDSAHVGYVAPVLAAAKGNPKGIQRIEDLTKEGLRVGLTDPQYSTCGEMVFALLEKKGIKDAVLRNVENRLTKGHSNLGTFMQTGAVDAVIMWNGVAHTFKDHLEIVPIPYEYETDIRVHVIGLNYSQNPELVEQFISFVKEQGTDIFASYGYIK